MSATQTSNPTDCTAHLRRIVECLRDLQNCIGIVCDENPQLEDELIDQVDSLADRLAEIETALALAGASPERDDARR